MPMLGKHQHQHCQAGSYICLCLSRCRLDLVDFSKVDIFVPGIGSSGKIIGLCNYLKEKNPNAKFNLCALCNWEEAWNRGGVPRGWIQNRPLLQTLKKMRLHLERAKTEVLKMWPPSGVDKDGGSGTVWIATPGLCVIVLQHIWRC